MKTTAKLLCVLALYGVAACEKRRSASGPQDNVIPRQSQPNSPATDSKYVRESATDHTLPPNIRRSAAVFVRVLDGEESDKRALDQAVKELAATRNEKTVKIWMSMMRASEEGLPDVLPSLEELRKLAEQAEKGMLKTIASNPVRFMDVLRPCVIYLTQFDMPEADREVTDFTQRFKSKYGDTPLGKHYLDAYLMEIEKAKGARKAGAVSWKYDRKSPSGID